MTPNEYEIQVARAFEQEGFVTELTGSTGDLGVDVIATRGTQRLAIQAKMYGTGRRVNAEMLLQLEGARRYFDCTSAVIATDGDLTPSAQKVAEELRIEIRRIAAAAPSGEGLHVIPVHVGGAGERDDFDRIWSDHVLPLAGQVLCTLGQGLENTVTLVDWRGLTRISSKGKTQFIPIEIFRWAVRRILSHGWVSKAEINDQFKGRASSMIATILAQAPEFEYSVNPLVIRTRNRR